MDTFNSFANKLAKYTINIKEYLDSCNCKQPDLQDYIEENEEKMDTISNLNDVRSVREKTQATFTPNQIEFPEDTSFSFGDADFDINGGVVIPQPSTRKSAIRTPLTSVDLQQVSSARTPPRSSQQCSQLQQQQNHSHSSPSAFSPPSILTSLMQEKTPTKSTRKKTRFELNIDDQTINLPDSAIS
jgi:hypothetical protein